MSARAQKAIRPALVDVSNNNDGESTQLSMHIRTDRKRCRKLMSAFHAK